MSTTVRYGHVSPSQLSAAFLAPLERLVVVLVEHYPRLSGSSAHSCHVALLQVLLSLVPKGPLLHSFVSHVGEFSHVICMSLSLYVCVCVCVCVCVHVMS